MRWPEGLWLLVARRHSHIEVCLRIYCWWSELLALAIEGRRPWRYRSETWPGDLVHWFSPKQGLWHAADTPKSDPGGHAAMERRGAESVAFCPSVQSMPPALDVLSSGGKPRRWRPVRAQSNTDRQCCGGQSRDIVPRRVHFLSTVSHAAGQERESRTVQTAQRRHGREAPPKCTEGIVVAADWACPSFLPQRPLGTTLRDSRFANRRRRS